MASLLEQLRYARVAYKLRGLSIAPPTGDDALIQAYELLAEYTPEERAKIAQLAIEAGGDPTNVAQLVKLVEGEVIEVGAKPPRKRWPWWVFALLGVGVVGVGGYAIRRRGKRRRALAGPARYWGPREGSRAKRAPKGPSPYGRPGGRAFTPGDEIFVDTADGGVGVVVSDDGRKLLVDIGRGPEPAARKHTTYRISSIR